MAIRVSRNRVAIEDIPLNLSKGNSIASAATINLATATGNFLHITGSTGPITSFGIVPAGTMFTLVFDGTPTINYNASTMILNSGVSNYTCTGGDRAILLSEGSGNWVVSIIKRDGTSIVSSGGSSGGTVDVASSRALSAGDDGKTLNITAGSDITLTVPAGLPNGFGCAVYQSAGGAAIFSPSGATITPATSGNTKTGGLGKIVSLVQTSNNAYSLSGGTA
jgi:hypothetical protein